MATEIELFRCLDTNVGILVRDTETGEVAAVDAPDGAAILAVLERKNWPLNHILITHAHADHIQGIDALRKAHECRVIAPEKSRELVQRADLWVGDGDIVRVGALHFEVMATPGHSQDHVSYRLEEEKQAFIGDVLFVMGCGRVFAGDYKGMWHSLQRLSHMPDETLLYCGHDYALNNGRFALQVEPDNEDIKQRMQEVEAARDKVKIFMPTTLGDEKKTNPFLREHLPQVAAMVDKNPEEPERVFRALRDWKDSF